MALVINSPAEEFYAFIPILGIVSYSLQQQSLSSVKIGGVLPCPIGTSQKSTQGAFSYFKQSYRYH